MRVALLLLSLVAVLIATAPRDAAACSCAPGPTAERYQRADAAVIGTVISDDGRRGRIRVEDDGRYEFQTMLPKPYTVPTDGPVGRYLEAVGQHPWRPAHIHFKVDAPGHRRLVTQVFFPDDPYLENDTIGAVKPALVRPLEPEDDHFACRFDIALRPVQARAA